MELRVVCGDITTWKCDAIVNSASESLLGDSALDMRIHQAGGLSFRSACSSLGGCQEGKAVLTYGYDLPARYVIHTVPPYWRGGAYQEEALLLSCYRSCLALATAKQMQYVAFSPIGIEDKRILPNRAAAVAIPVLVGAGAALQRIDLVCETAKTLRAYTKAAVYFWLQKVSDIQAAGPETIWKEALLALTVLRPAGDNSPDRQADRLVSVRQVLQAYKARPASIVALEETAAKIMEIYET